VFPAPYRAMITARSHTEASAIRETIDGKRCSVQAFCIFPKIAEVDLSMTPVLQERVSEGHPEVSFTALLEGVPLDDRKSTPSGQARRLEALLPHFPALDAVMAQRRSSGVARDDILDAFVMLWTARRVAAKIAVSVPHEEQLDSKGLLMRIVA
jgi:predicted RNase H-like nuclease